ncbi:MAG: MlaD family protein [Beijerinckiaceae bacterium]
MESRANYALIGLFTLAVVAAMFGFAVWFAGGRANGQRPEYRIVFSGSVSGLGRGASVLFNGLRVGEVTSISLLPEDPKRVVAIAEVDASVPVRSDTRARLEYQGLTGVAAVAMSGGEPGAQALTAPPGQRPTIFADRSDFQDIMETVQRLSRRVDDVINRADKLFSDNEESIGRTIRNVETFTQSLASNSDGVNRFLSSVAAAGDRIAALSSKLETLSTDLNAVIAAVEPQRVSRIVGNIETFTDAIGANRAQIDSFLKDGAALTKRLSDASVTLEQTLTDASALMKAVDAAAVNRSIQNVEKFASSLGKESDRVDQIVRDASELTKKLNASADRVDGVLAAIQEFFGSGANGQAEGVIVQIGEAAKSIRVLADNLDKRTADITTGVNKLTGPGLRNLDALVSDGRRTLNDVSRTVRSLEKNPSQVIFGGQSSLPEYQGRR